MVVLHLALLQSHSGDPVSESTFSIQMFKGIPYSLICTFIIISGYFYVRGRTFAENIMRRVLKLLIYFVLAVVVLNTLMYIILSLEGYEFELSSLWDVIWQTIVGKGAFSDLGNSAVYGGEILSLFEVTHALYFYRCSW